MALLNQLHLWFLIALGGAAGTLARYGTITLLARITERWLFPVGTAAVNLLGCLAIGYLQGLFAYRLIAPEYRFALTVGFLGGFTTFSTFGMETAGFLRDGQFARATVNLLLQNVAGIALVMLGYALSRPRP